MGAYTNGGENIFRIIVFDDDKLSCEQTKKILEQYGSEKDMDMSVDTADNETALFQYLKTHEDVAVAFLDIHTETGRNGIELAAEINRLSPEISVVFLTGYLEYARDVYEVQHVYFVLKDEFAERLDAIMGKLSAERERRKNGTVFFQMRDRGIVLRNEDIMYIERIGHSTVIQCRDERYQVTERLESIEKRLDSFMFVRCHNSYIVNFMAVKEFFAEILFCRIKQEYQSVDISLKMSGNSFLNG